MTKTKDVSISIRIPVTLRELIRRFVERDTHLNESDFIRDAIREKIKRDAPELYEQILRG